MKKIYLFFFSFSLAHYLPNSSHQSLIQIKKSIDNDDNYFKSLCPRTQDRCKEQSVDCDCHNYIAPLIKIDREDMSTSNDCLLKVERDSVGSINKFRRFANNFTEVL
jgi:hypothetical protein